MSVDLVFRACNSLALLGWALLIFLGRFRLVAGTVCKFLLPGFLAMVYLGLIAAHWPGHPGGFDSVVAVQKLFADPWLLTAGWVHYLAFDLFLGAWQARDAQRLGVPHLWIIPSLILTFLFGPIGFLAYLATREAYHRYRPRPKSEGLRPSAITVYRQASSAKEAASPEDSQRG